ncbi:hypothetical protein RC083_05895 [Pseudoalteromonas haloplanktis]|uniref:Lipoprotein n=1 Tax=Pseudoalteromonas haloplanktis TaxID=228 RepID=A0ABU1B9U0_PSEHA|nr:hypothetical protein [Pseudoalteromonas haloplanktis]MDQ9091121.1 hypothetical protein [Pseudoalteromonas haloplanktis]
MSTFNKLTKIAVFVGLSIALIGCRSTKTEQQQYHELQDGIFYGAYYGVSTVSVDTLAYTYNTVQELNESENELLESIDPAITHATLSFLIGLGVSADFAVAESDLAYKKADNPRAKYLAYSAQSLAFYSQGWRGLAKQRADLIKHDPMFAAVKTSYPKDQLIAYLILGSSAVHNGDLTTANEMFTIIGEQIDKPWLPSVAKAVTFAFNGSFFNAVDMLQVLLTDPSLTQYERAKLAELEVIAQSSLSTTQKQQAMANLADNFVFEKIKSGSSDLYQQYLTDLQSYAKGII